MKIRAWENTLDCIIQKMNTLGDKRKVQSFTGYGEPRYDGHTMTI